MTWLLLAIVLAALVLALVLWGELEHWRSSRRQLGTKPGQAEAGEVIVVLGFWNRAARANAINRWRVRAALRSREPGLGPSGLGSSGLGPSRLVLCGGAVGGAVPEAELMATYARESCGYDGELTTETGSRSTWENIQNAIPFLETAGRIKIVSNSLHAEKARLYLRRHRPDLADRLVPAADYRFGELIWVKPALAALGLLKLRRARSRADRSGA